jgi:hypothetical protein
MALVVNLQIVGAGAKSGDFMGTLQAVGDDILLPFVVSQWCCCLDMGGHEKHPVNLICWRQQWRFKIIIVPNVQ